MPRSAVASFVAGFRCPRRRDVPAVIVFGYTTPFALGVLLGARTSHKPVFTQSDSTLASGDGRHAVRDWLKRSILRVLYSSKGSVAWVISAENLEYWWHYGIRRFARVDFESPVPVHPGACQEAQNLRSSMGLTGHDKVILTVCRITRGKGVGELSEAVRALRRQGVPAHLVVVGKASEPDVIDEGPGVTLLGSLERGRLAGAYLMADVFALASHDEPYGLVVREALQFGLPVVATDGVPAARHLCDHGWNVVETKSVEALAAALHRALLEGRWTARPPVTTWTFYAKQLHSVLAL